MSRSTWLGIAALLTIAVLGVLTALGVIPPSSLLGLIAVPVSWLTSSPLDSGATPPTGSEDAEDADDATPPTGVGRSGRTGRGVALLVVAGVAGGLCGGGCGGALTQGQAAAAKIGVSLTCDLARLLLSPDVTGVSEGVAEWTDRICTGGETVTAVVLPWMTEAEVAQSVDTRDAGLYLRASAPVRSIAVSCEQISRGCAQDGAPEDVCAEVLTACGEGRAITIPISRE